MSLAFGALVWIFPNHRRVPYRTAHILVLAGITIAKSQTLLPMRKGNLIHVLAIMARWRCGFCSMATWSAGASARACLSS